MSQYNSELDAVEQKAEEAARAVTMAAERRPLLSITAISGVLFGLAGFYEPLKDAYKSYTDSNYADVSSIPAADAQRALWMQNSDCVATMQMQEYALEHDINIRTGACPNHHVLVQVYPKNGPAVSSWITPLATKTKVAGLFSAMAAPMTLALEQRRSGETNATPVQMKIETVCHAWADQGRSKLIRIVNENRKCIKEITNVFSGKIEYREPVACDTKCQ